MSPWMSKIKEMSENKSWQGGGETGENVKQFGHFEISSNRSSSLNAGNGERPSTD